MIFNKYIHNIAYINIEWLVLVVAYCCSDYVNILLDVIVECPRIGLVDNRLMLICR